MFGVCVYIFLLSHFNRDDMMYFIRLNTCESYDHDRSRNQITLKFVPGVPVYVQLLRGNIRVDSSLRLSNIYVLVILCIAMVCNKSLFC